MFCNTKIIVPTHKMLCIVFYMEAATRRYRLGSIATFIRSELFKLEKVH